jgi:hypothetical protein
MRKVIHHLRKQPEETKRHILHVLTFCSGVILVILWIFSLGKNISNDDTQAKLKQDLSPLSVIKNNAVEGYQNITGSQAATPLTAE